MSNSEQLSIILDLCIKIDQAAVEIYTNLSAAAGSKALKSFWDKTVAEGRSHLEYWQQLKSFAAKGELPQAFDDPGRVIKELEERAQRIKGLDEQWGKDKTINNAFVIAYRLESNKLHPAFRTLFQYYRPIMEGRLPEEKEFDETNINDFVTSLHNFAEVTPELALVGETLQRLWAQNKVLSEQAMIDPLSKMLNRRGFFMMAQQIAHLSKRNQNPIAVLMVEFDDFKSIIELHGPQKGDEIIKIVAGRLQSEVRQSDLIARYGGSKFIILLPDSSEEGGVAVAKKIVKAVILTRPLKITVTVSIGVSEDVMGGDTEQAFSKIIRYAEKNLIIAKKEGKNQIIY